MTTNATQSQQLAVQGRAPRTTTRSIYAVFWASVSYLGPRNRPDSSMKLTTKLTTRALV